MPNGNEQKFEIIKQAIKTYVPGVAKFFDFDENILEYSKQLYNFHIEPKHLERQKPIKEEIKKQLELLWPDRWRSFRLNLDKPLIANIADHNGILNDQILFASHIVSSAFQLFDSQSDILSLNTGMYPFNYLMYNRGLTFQEKIYPLISRDKSHQLVYYAKSLKLDSLPEPISDIYQSCDTPASEEARHQASRINYNLWPLLFEPGLKGKTAPTYCHQPGRYYNSYPLPTDQGEK